MGKQNHILTKLIQECGKEVQKELYLTSTISSFMQKAGGVVDLNKNTSIG